MSEANQVLRCLVMHFFRTYTSQEKSLERKPDEKFRGVLPKAQVAAFGIDLLTGKERRNGP